MRMLTQVQQAASFGLHGSQQSAGTPTRCAAALPAGIAATATQSLLPSPAESTCSLRLRHQTTQKHAGLELPAMHMHMNDANACTLVSLV